MPTLVFNLSQLSKIYQIYAKVLHNKQRQGHFSTRISLEQSIMKHDKPQELNNVTCYSLHVTCYSLPYLYYLAQVMSFFYLKQNAVNFKTFEYKLNLNWQVRLW